jgi:hypothetical protein
MKLLVALIVLALASAAFAAAEKKEVCSDVKDKAGKVVKNKDGSTKQSCKIIKVHKKVEGTPVPVKK